MEKVDSDDNDELSGDGNGTGSRRSFWSKRNEAYTVEVEEFERLLYELCQTLVSPPHTSRGPKPLSTGDVIQCMVTKIFYGVSAKRAEGLLRRLEKSGLIKKAPSASCLLYYFNREEITPILHYLIGLTALVFRDLENHFAIDGTALKMRDYLDFTETYTANRAGGHRYIMLHAYTGINTNIITAARVDVCLGKYFHLRHDSQWVRDLTYRTMKLGFKITALWGDKGYDSSKTRKMVEDLGAEDHVTRRRLKGYRKKKKVEKSQDMPRRARNRVETVFSMITGVFGGDVSSQKQTALVNEALCIVIAHNLRVLIHHMRQHGLEIDFRALAEGSRSPDEGGRHDGNSPGSQEA